MVVAHLHNQCSYQKQHQIFIQHATQQITQLEQQKQQLEQQMLASVLPNAAAILPAAASLPPQQQQQSVVPKIPPLMAQKVSMPDDDDEIMKPPGVDDSNYSGGVGGGPVDFGNTNRNHHYQQQQQQQQPQKQKYDNNINYGQTNGPQQNNFTLDNMTQPNSTGNFFIPDMSKPPPGFSGAANAAVNPMPIGLQQPFAQMNNIPHTGNNSSGVGASSIDAPNLKAAGSNIDVLALNAAIQLVLKQQNQMQNSQQNTEATVQHLTHTDMSTTVPQLTQGQMPPLHLLDNEEVSTGQLAVMTPQTEAEEQKPSAPYYDLPAGLMVPLIRLDDYNYKPLDPADIRLPPPAPQSERLTNALAAFYAPPTHDRPRDTYAFILINIYYIYII